MYYDEKKYDNKLINVLVYGIRQFYGYLNYIYCIFEVYLYVIICIYM